MITYTLSNDTSGTINVTVVPVNDAPVAADDAAEAISNATVTINVLDNDTDIDYDNLSIVSATAPNGVVTINADNTLEYTSNPDFSGTDTITYTVDDGNGGSDTASVTVTVSPINAMIQTAIYDKYSDSYSHSYLDNLTLHYYKDGEDTGFSTLVENGAISFDQAIEFDLVKLTNSESSDYMLVEDVTLNNPISADDAVPVLQDYVRNVGVDMQLPSLAPRISEYDSVLDATYYNIDPNSFNWHAADVDNNGEIGASDAVDILSHLVKLKNKIYFEIDTFDLIDNTTFERVTSLDVGVAEISNWTIVANGDAYQDGIWDANYVVDIV